MHANEPDGDDDFVIPCVLCPSAFVCVRCYAPFGVAFQCVASRFGPMRRPSGTNRFGTAYGQRRLKTVGHPTQFDPHSTSWLAAGSQTLHDVIYDHIYRGMIHVRRFAMLFDGILCGEEAEVARVTFVFISKMRTVFCMIILAAVLVHIAASCSWTYVRPMLQHVADPATSYSRPMCREPVWRIVFSHSDSDARGSAVTRAHILQVRKNRISQLMLCLCVCLCVLCAREKVMSMMPMPHNDDADRPADDT